MTHMSAVYRKESSESSNQTASRTEIDKYLYSRRGEKSKERKRESSCKWKKVVREFFIIVNSRFIGKNQKERKPEEEKL